jgi:hypothetical protein
MQLIIPDYHARAHEVFASVGSCKSMPFTTYSVASLNSNTMVVARFIFDSLQKANRSELTEFSNATHISQYLPNPWIGVFLALRELLSLGETRKIKANTDASQPLEYQASRDSEESSKICQSSYSIGLWKSRLCYSLSSAVEEMNFEGA